MRAIVLRTNAHFENDKPGLAILANFLPIFSVCVLYKTYFLSEQILHLELFLAFFPFFFDRLQCKLIETKLCILTRGRRFPRYFSYFNKSH